MSGKRSLRPCQRRAVDEANRARLLAGLAPIEIKSRRCLACGKPFESTGNRFCGCLPHRTTTAYSGREIL